MKRSGAARRVPRRIGTSGSGDEEDPTESPVTTVRRPKSTSRKSSSLRQSFADDEDAVQTTVVAPKRSANSRVTIQRNASKRSLLLSSQLLQRNVEEDGVRPSYSASSLQELKDSTPATPLEFSSSELEKVATGTQELDLSSKFGNSLSRYGQSSAIPSATEIAEKKARRARLAKEQQADEYISLDPDDPDLDDDDNVMKDEQGRLVLKPKDKYGQLESRLVADDEDIMENFDEFTEDGKVALGGKAEAEHARRRKQDMAQQIAEAEGGPDSDSDASEQERNAAFEAAQTRHGTFAQYSTRTDSSDLRPKTPPIITPLPTLDGVIEQLRNRLASMQSSRMQKLQEMESLQREKIRLAEEEVRIQRALKETADKFETLRREKGIVSAGRTNLPAIDAPPASITNGNALSQDAKMVDDVGIEEDDDPDDASEEDGGHTTGLGLGFGGARQGLGAGAGFAGAVGGEDGNEQD